MRKSLLAAGLLALVAAGRVHATSLPPGGSVTPETGSVSFSSVVDSKQVSYSFKGNTGVIAEAVVVDSVTGNYDFVYQVQPSAGTVFNIKLAGYNNVGGPASGNNLNVFQQTSPITTPNAGFVTGDVALTNAARSNGSGDNVNWTYAGSGSSVGNPSELVVFQTNVQAYQKNEQAVITFDSGGTSNPSDRLIFAPRGGAVPEPASLLIWSGVAGGLGLFAWRKRKRQAGVSRA
jgi:hypothetical protein